MRGVIRLFPVVMVIVLVAAVGGPARATTASAWHSAEEVPGLAALNQDGDAQATAVSCPSAGNCSVGGFYGGANFTQQLFVASEVNGVWHNAIQVPGTNQVNGEVAFLYSLSCASPGNCSAGGSYVTSSGRQAWVASEVNGVWHNAIEVPGTAVLNSGGGASTSSMSCAHAGDCTAGGQYTDHRSHTRAFVVNETNGTWGTAIEIPGTGSLAQSAGVSTVSCASAGNCAAGGFYHNNGSGNEQAFVADETNGTWGTAIKIPGTGVLNTGQDAELDSLSCPTVVFCGGGGFYTDSSGAQQGYVVNRG